MIVNLERKTSHITHLRAYRSTVERNKHKSGFTTILRKKSPN